MKKLFLLPLFLFLFSNSLFANCTKNPTDPGTEGWSLTGITQGSGPSCTCAYGASSQYTGSYYTTSCGSSTCYVFNHNCYCASDKSEFQGQCLPKVTCNNGYVPINNGTYCSCPSATHAVFNGACLPKVTCNNGYEPINSGTNCGCNSPKRVWESQCLPRATCNNGYEPILNNGTACACPNAKEVVGTQCLTKCVLPETRNPTTLACELVITESYCTNLGKDFVNGKCEEKCGTNEGRTEAGACACVAGYKLENGTCVEDCVHGSFLEQGQRCCDKIACKEHGGDTPGYQLFCLESGQPIGNGEFEPVNGICLTPPPCEGGIVNHETNECVCTLPETYDPTTGACVTPTPQCGPGQIINEHGKCEKDHGDCEGCNTLGGTADFTYQVSAGGVNSDLYVCEVGFKASACADGSCGLNYIDFDGRIIRYGETSNPWINVDTRIKHGEINVYLNSVKAVSSFYVKYCLDIDRKIVGAPPGNKTIYGSLEGTVDYTSGVDNNYYSNVGLQAEVFHGCGGTLDLIDSHMVVSGEGDSVPTNKCLTLASTAVTKCAWEVVYTETNACLRKLFKDIDAATGVVTNNTSSGMVTTNLGYDLTFTGHSCN